MKNRILSVLLVVAMLASMIVMPVYATEPAAQSVNATPASCPCGGTNCEWTEVSGASSGHLIEDTNTYHFKLTGNYYKTANARLFQTGAAATVIIDLNGYELYTNVEGGSARIPLNIQKGATVHIIDSSAAGTGKIWSNSNGTNGNAWGTAIMATTGSKVIMWGGTIVANPLDAASVGSKYTSVYVGADDATYGDSSFTLKGGVVEGSDGAVMTSAYGGAIHCAGGNVSIEGGVVEANTAGYGIGVTAGSTVTISGQPTVANLDLTSGALADVSGLTGGSVAVTAAPGTVFTTGESASAAQYVTSAAFGTTALVNGTELYIKCPHCDATDITWTELTAKSGTVSEDTHYYLTADLSRSGNFVIAADVCLDLRGNEMKRSSDARFAEVQADKSLVFIDSVGGGQVSGGTDTINVAAGATFKAYNITLTNHTASDRTGTGNSVISCSSTSGTVYLENCTVLANQTYKFYRGGAIIGMAADVTLKNCTVTGGKVTNYGGAIYLSTGTLTLDNTTVTDGTADIAGNGIWINNGGTVIVKGGSNVGSINIGSTNARINVTGKATITNADVTKADVETQNALIEVGTLDSTSSIGVTALTDLPFTTGDASAYASNFTSKVDGYVVTANENGKLMLSAPVVAFTKYCHDCGADVEWSVIDINDTNRHLVTTGDVTHYYLEADVSKPGVIRAGATADSSTNESGKEYHIELNGKTMACSNKDLSTLNVIAGNTLHIQNSETTGGIGANKNAFEMGTGAALSLYGVTVTASSDATTVNGGVCLRGGSNATITATNCTFDGSARDSGTYVGAVYIPAGANATFTGCTFKGCTTTSNGGAMRIVEGGTVTLSGCTVIGGTATSGGGISTSGALTLEDTAIYGGTATEFGADLRVEESGTLNIIGDVTCGTQDAMKVSFSAVNWNYGTAITGTTVSGGTVCPMVMDNYYNAGIFADAGTLHVAAGLAVIDINDNATFFTDAAAAQAAYDIDEDICLKVCGVSTFELTENAWIDVNGCDFEVTGTGVTANLYDSSNDDYSGFGNVTIADELLGNGTCANVNGKEYYTVQNAETGAYSFHVLDMAITSVSLATNAGGMYYWATYNCDDTLAANIESYGIKYELYDENGVNEIGTSDIVGVVNGGIEDPRTEVPIMLIKNIVGSGVNGYTDAQTGKMQIKGTPYVVIGGVEYTGATVSKSLYDLCVMLDEMITAGATQYTAYLDNLLNEVWKAYDLTEWTFENVTVTR